MTGLFPTAIRFEAGVAAFLFNTFDFVCQKQTDTCAETKFDKIRKPH
jgi:hypothetical protein